MPNYCSCDLFIHGRSRDLIVEAVQGESPFDFNKIIPMPSILVGTVSPAPEGSQKALAARNETGFTDWYDWCVAKWGTKWPADSVHAYIGASRLKYTFETAWSPPLSVIHALSLQFPNNTFTLKYYEQGMGFKGEYKVKNGEVLINTDAPYRGNRGG